MVCAHFGNNSEFVVTACGANHGGTIELADVYRGKSDTTGRAVHQKCFTGLQHAALQPVVGRCVVVAKGGGCCEIDACRHGGSTILYSDIYNLSNYNDIQVSYWRWYTNNLGNNPGNDVWNVQVSSDGTIWIDLENTTTSLNQWQEKRFVLSNYIELTAQVQFRFIASDIFNDGDNGSGGSLVEAALDDFKLEIIGYESSLGNLNLDSEINILDVVILVNIVLGEIIPSQAQLESADINQDSEIDVLDIVGLVNMVLGS